MGQAQIIWASPCLGISFLACNRLLQACAFRGELIVWA